MIEHLRRSMPRDWLDPLVMGLARAGVSPNALTCAGLAVTVAAGSLAAAGHLVAAGLVNLLGGGMDALDGALARATGRTSTFGALLDSTLDRLGEAAVLLGMLVYAAGRDALQEVLLAGLALTGSFMVSYVRARAEGLGIACEVGVLTRSERVLLLSLGLLSGLTLPALAVVAVFAHATAVQRLLYVWRQTAGKPGQADRLEDTTRPSAMPVKDVRDPRWPQPIHELVRQHRGAWLAVNVTKWGNRAPLEGEFLHRGPSYEALRAQVEASQDRGSVIYIDARPLLPPGFGLAL